MFGLYLRFVDVQTEVVVEFPSTHRPSSVYSFALCCCPCQSQLQEDPSRWRIRPALPCRFYSQYCRLIFPVPASTSVRTSLSPLTAKRVRNSIARRHAILFCCSPSPERSSNGLVSSNTCPVCWYGFPVAASIVQLLSGLKSEISFLLLPNASFLGRRCPRRCQLIADEGSTLSSDLVCAWSKVLALEAGRGYRVMESSMFV